MKRLMIAAAIAAAVFGLYGCNKSEDAGGSTPPATTDAKPAEGAGATGAAPSTNGAAPAGAPADGAGAPKTGG
jgi:hypothetical protein